MKNILLLILCLPLYTFVHAQESAIDKYLSGFQKQHELDLTSISPRMFTIYLRTADAKKKKQLTDVVRELTGMKILSKKNTTDGEALLREASSLLGKEYTALSEVNSKEKQVSVYTKEAKDGAVTELVMLSYQDKHFKILSITGTLSLEKIMKLSEDIRLNRTQDF